MKNKIVLTLLFAVITCHSFGQGNRYVKVVGRDSGKPLDSCEISFYQVVGSSFIPVGESSLTDAYGLAIVPKSISADSNIDYKVLASPQKILLHHHSFYGPTVKEINGFTSDTLVIQADLWLACPPIIYRIYFAFDRANLIDFYKPIADSVVKFLKENPLYKIEIQGHTDNIGSNDYNINLSQNRADNVKAYLISKGISKDRISTKALGSSMPIVPNINTDGQDDPEGRARNRRLEFRIIPDKPDDGIEIEYDPSIPQSNEAKK